MPPPATPPEDFRPASSSSSPPSSPGQPQVVRVRRDILAACMTCPLCYKILREATTISECLHTFCRKCIFEKLTDEEVDYCPICNLDLGCVPVEKLRPDHSLQGIRTKIFPLKRRKVNAPEFMPSISLPVRRKERSLSSLVVNTPRIASQSGLTGRRTKAVARRAAALRGLCASINEPPKKEDDTEDQAENSSSLEMLRKVAPSRRQTSSNAESSTPIPRSDENVGDTFIDKAELWKPLNCLVEAANRTKSLKSSPQSPVVKAEQLNGTDSDQNIPKGKVKDHLYNNKPKVQDEKNGCSPLAPVSAKAKKLQGISRRRKELGPSAQALLDAASKRERRICPVWFSLVSSADQEKEAQLPQISTGYLRIKDGNLPVSFIQKYLVQKLDLSSESEVEIICRGQPVLPTLALHNLVDLWLRTGSSQKVHALVGTSAKDFVMVLNYRRRLQPSS